MQAGDEDSVDVAETTEEGEEWLTTSEFILMNLSRHYSFGNYSMYKTSKPSEAHNFFHIIIAYVMVGIPIGYMEIVLGQYTNMGMFNIRHLMPIAQGMSYTFCLQVVTTTTLCVITMTQYLVYAMLSVVHAINGNTMPWLECPKNFTDTCFYPSARCADPTPCITRRRHLSSYIYWNKVYMREILDRDEADIGMVPTHRLIALLITWCIVWVSMTMSFKRCKKFIKRAFIVLLVHKILQFMALLFGKEYMMYFPYMINLHIPSFYNLQSWKNAIQMVTGGMGLGDFSYIMFGILSKTGRKTGSLMWFCGLISCVLTLTDHIIISGATYHLCDMANLPIDERYLLFRPSIIEPEFGVMPIILSTLTAAPVWTAAYFMHRFMVLLFHAMLNYSFLQLSLYQRYPGLPAYGVYIKPLFCIFGFCVSLLLDSRESYAFRYDTQRVVIEFCDQFNIIIITIIVFYAYGVLRFCDDVHFMTGQEPAKFWITVWILSPLAILISLTGDIFDTDDSFYPYRLITVAIFYSPYIIFLAITVVQRIYQKQLLKLLRSTENWAPKDPTLKLYRMSFNPRFDSKRKNKSYKCVHKCLIGESPPHSEDEEED